MGQNTSYNPKNYEDRVWTLWEQNGLFDVEDGSSEKEPYVILMPPPNVTSQLHMGHGSGYTVQDILIRFKRMSGFQTVWLPGTDHAGIATQMMVEKSLEKQGLSRQKLGRQAFVTKCEDWRVNYGNIILSQFKKMGFSATWPLTAYTMDEQLSEAVRQVFVALYEEGLIYRGERLVNWDCTLQTALSDDEIENREVSGYLWHFKYPISDSNSTLTIATTRPETILGDSAVAVNPDDERYSHLIGKTVTHPFLEKEIPIIGDQYVKMDFGSGVLKVTPAHDFNDFEIGNRHSLECINILDDEGKILPSFPKPFACLDRFQARKTIVKELEKKELLVEIEPYKTTIPYSERSKTVIEPRLSKQWYVSMKSMAHEAAAAARRGELKFHPASWEKTYYYWLDNIQDWCISRQLWWGHQIPIWYCDDCHGESTSVIDLSRCQHCGSANITQDPDVLDTWFSSWLWPLSPFGWPSSQDEKGNLLERFFPSNVLVTAPDIIFLWVARMVMAGLKLKGAVPFKDVYFNAVVCDKKGRKFSKTLGNGIDPLDVIDLHGADAVRFTAVSLAPLGGRVRMDNDDFQVGARFINKLWNATRFVLGKYEELGSQPLADLTNIKTKLSENWLISRTHETAQKVNYLLDEYRINEAIDEVYHFIWGDFCDWGIEAAKDSLTDPQLASYCLSALIYALDSALRLAHPFIPFVTEELWQMIPRHPNLVADKLLASSNYPGSSEMIITTNTENASLWKKVQEVITKIRSVRTESNIAPGTKIEILLQIDPDYKATIELSSNWIKRLTNTEKLTVAESLPNPGGALTAIGKGFVAYIPAADYIDISKETLRLKKELTRLEKVLTGLDKKLNNTSFLEKAPDDVKTATIDQHANIKRQLEAIQANIASLAN